MGIGFLLTIDSNYDQSEGRHTWWLSTSFLLLPPPFVFCAICSAANVTV